MNDTMHLLPYQLLEELLLIIFDLLSHHHLIFVVISVLQWCKTDVSTSIGWNNNNIAVNRICIFFTPNLT